MRKIKRKTIKRKKKIIIVSALTLLLCLTTIYAAFSTNLNLNAKGNIVILKDLYVASFGSDTKGNGTREKPYATIQKAYNMASDAASIHILDNISQKDTIYFDKDKEIILDSVNNNSIIRNDSLTDTLLNITAGTTTFKDITFDGNNVEANSTLIIATSDVNVNSGTIFTKIYSDGLYGGGSTIRMNLSGTLTLNGGEFFNNYYPNGGGSAIHMRGQNTILIINDTNIHDNYSKDGAIWSSGQIFFYNGKIYNTVSTFGAGGIFNNGIMNMYGGEIYNNKAHYDAGVRNYNLFYMYGGEITKNVSEDQEQSGGLKNGCYHFGWGLYVQGTSEVCEGCIHDNSPRDCYTNYTYCDNPVW